jgi:hypothetical protein
LPTEKTARSAFDLSTQEKRKKQQQQQQRTWRSSSEKTNAAFFSYSKNIRKERI